MALQVAHGLFRLWLVLPVLWVAGVGYLTWQTFPEDYVVLPSDLNARKQELKPGEFDPHEFLASRAAKQRRSAIWQASLLAFLPPAFVLALGSTLVWAFRETFSERSIRRITERSPAAEMGRGGLIRPPESPAGRAGGVRFISCRRRR
jgi:hypothetical protein